LLAEAGIGFSVTLVSLFVLDAGMILMLVRNAAGVPVGADVALIA
jgi:hypothetical protein